MSLYGPMSLSRLFIFVLCTATADCTASGNHSLHKGRKQTKLWYSFTASFCKMSGNTIIWQQDIDNFIQTEVMPKIDGFKLVETTGVWKGQTQDSLDIFILSNEFSKMLKKIRHLSYKYKKKFAQDSVLLFYERAKVFFL